MSNIQNLLKQSSYYFISNIIIILCGFISFPIWTRIFTQAEYGILSLINITVTLGAGVSKFGLQHAALRYYSDFNDKKIDLDISYYYTTMLTGSVLISGLTTMAALLAVEIFFKNYLDLTLAKLVPFVAAVIFLQSINSLLTIFIRAEERGFLYSVISILDRYGKLLFALLLIFYFSKNVYGWLLGWTIAEAMTLAGLISLYIKRINFSHMSSIFLKSALYYGFPLIWMELSNLLLNFGDRYLIQYYMGPESVGVYSAGYNLSAMAQSLLSVPLRLAVMPMYMNMWNRAGEEETKKFISQILNYYFMAGMPIVIGMSWFGKDIITILATAKFREAEAIIPYIMLPLILHGAYVIYGAGLFIKRRTKILMYLTVFSVLINMAANVILIPRFGILGAAYATLIAYMVMVILIFTQSYRYLKIKIQITPLVMYTALSVLTMFLISFFQAYDLKKLMLKTVAAMIVYSIGILALDGTLRRKVFSYAGLRGV